MIGWVRRSKRQESAREARPEFPTFLDPEQRGSRFSSRAAMAILVPSDGEGGDPREVAAAVLTPANRSVIPDLGEGQPISGSYGRGASGWATVIEWALQAAIAGLIGEASWKLAKLQARQLRALVDRLRSDGTRIAISRGAAVWIAIAHVTEEAEGDEILDVEAAKEPSVIAGRTVSEISYVDFEPWLIFLVNESRTARYIVAVSPMGEVLNWMKLPMEELERMYAVLPPRD